MAKKENNRPVNMKDIAAKAGVSPSTVSRALRKDPRITKPVCKRVEAAAKELGYKPNPFVSALTAQVRSYRCAPQGATIALLDCMPANDQNEISHLEYEKGARNQAEKLGFSIDKICMRDIENSFRTLNRILWHRGISGVLFLPVPSDFVLKGFQMERLALASIDDSLKKPALHRATPNYFNGMIMAMDQLKEKGYKRIGFCSYEDEMDRIASRWDGAYLHWQTKNKAPKIPVYVTKDWKSAPLVTWLKKFKVDAIVTNNIINIDLLEELGFRVPEDLGYASLAVMGKRSKVSGIDQNQEEVGAAGINLVVGQIYRNEYGIPNHPMTVSIKGEWVDRDPSGK